MDARSEPDLNDPFGEAIDDALSSLPADLRAGMSNVEIVVERLMSSIASERRAVAPQRSRTGGT
jgi:predicted Zn-dependent protease with MMP-like domain